MKVEWTNKDVLTQSETTGQSKTVLVIDTPSSCLLCPLNQNLKCGISKELVEMNNRPLWCPLRPMPQKKVPHFDPNASTYDEERERSIMNEIDGYNRCIDEIMGETK